MSDHEEVVGRVRSPNVSEEEQSERDQLMRGFEELNSWNPSDRVVVPEGITLHELKLLYATTVDNVFRRQAAYVERMRPVTEYCVNLATEAVKGREESPVLVRTPPGQDEGSDEEDDGSDDEEVLTREEEHDQYLHRIGILNRCYAENRLVVGRDASLEELKVLYTRRVAEIRELEDQATVRAGMWMLTALGHVMTTVSSKMRGQDPSA